MTTRYLVGGPSNSGKSTFTLTLVAHLRERRGLLAEAIEFDVWSRSFAAFRGETTFEGRAKDAGLDWSWQPPLSRQIEAFNASSCDVVLADLPGQLDEAIAFICRRVVGARALVVSRTIEGLDAWGSFFEQHGVPVAQRCLTFLDKRPQILLGMNRQVDPDHPDVAALGAALELPPGPTGRHDGGPADEHGTAEGSRCHRSTTTG